MSIQEGRTYKDPIGPIGGGKSLTDVPVEREVFGALNELENSVENLNNRLVTLFDRVAPVLNGAFQGIANKPTERTCCEVAERITKTVDRIDTMHEAICNILERLQV